MYSLDSSTFRLLYQNNQNVLRRIGAIPAENLWLSAIVVQEALAGRLSQINRVLGDKSKNAPDALEKAYAELLGTLEDIRTFSIIPYTRDDEFAFRQLAPGIKRVGAQDCRIAIQAHRRGYIVVTQNINDFEAAGIQCEDWSLNPKRDR